ncbi:MAG: hypothetical protein QCI82_04415 [Candidatus Thermoplasmatota archaeon]|nr:hypothetical protein [Candidatus Thermoplasmatota archaeon]
MMDENYQQAAFLIYCPGGRERDELSGSGSRLFEILTTNGYLGPSDITLLAPEDMQYSDLPPTPSNLLKVLSASHMRTGVLNECIIYLDSIFAEGRMLLDEGDLPLERISGFIEGMPCASVKIFLRGPGSDIFADALVGKGRLIVYTSRADGEPKIDDPFDVSALFTGDRILSESVDRERMRLKKVGYVLNWVFFGRE